MDVLEIDMIYSYFLLAIVILQISASVRFPKVFEKGGVFEFLWRGVTLDSLLA